MTSVGTAGRPRFHLTPRAGWINDPLGLTFHDDQYHLFYQHVPGLAEWALTCHWGHATSPDLMSWTERGVALSPGDGDDGCWSGGIAVPVDGDPVMFYTSVAAPDLDIGRVRIARPLDASWNAWAKDEVVAELPDDVDARAFRDPFVFRDRGQWRMLVGAGLADGTPTVLVYVSADLRNWRYEGPLIDRTPGDTDPIFTGNVWECPQLFPLDGRHGLVVSGWDAGRPMHVAAAVGDYAEGKFTPQSWQRLTYGPCYYAASTFTDRNSDRGLVAWLRGVREPDKAWAGALSIPHSLGLDAGRLVAAPHPDLAGYRVDPNVDGGPNTTGENGSHADPAEGGSDAIDVEWDPGPADTLLVEVDGLAVARVSIDGADLRVAANPAGSGLACAMPWESGRLRMVIDGPILELFADTGVMAVPLTPTPGTMTVVARSGSLRWWRLRRPRAA